jgi:hypothetical protein
VFTMGRPLVVLPALLLLAGVACNQTRSNSQRRVAEPYLPETASVPFDVEPVERANPVQMKATYTSQGKTARFTIELGSAKASGTSDFPIKTGEGRFIAESGSDASVLLADLQKALEAKKPPAVVPKSSSLPFTFAILGEHQSQTPGGGFSEKPRGNWTAMKIFIGEGDQEAEVFLNFNLVMRKGQFSMKDTDYADLVLRELARVL